MIYDQMANYTHDGKATVSKPDSKGGWVTPVELTGNILQEQKTQDDTVDNVITFSENISAIEIFHAEDTWQQFVVNGLTLNIPPGGYRTPIAGATGKTVTIPANIKCIVGRLV